IKLPFLVLLVNNLGKYWSFEVTILDNLGEKRRFRASNFQVGTAETRYRWNDKRKNENAENITNIFDIVDYGRHVKTVNENAGLLELYIVFVCRCEITLIGPVLVGTEDMNKTKR